MTPSPNFADIAVAVHEIGTRGSLSNVVAQKAATHFVSAIVALPDTEHMIAVGGYDDDPRELWDIPEARAFVRRFVGWVVMMMPGRAITDWKLAPESVAVLSVCAGFGRIKRETNGGWTVEIG